MHPVTFSEAVEEAEQHSDEAIVLGRYKTLSTELTSGYTPATHSQTFRRQKSALFLVEDVISGPEELVGQKLVLEDFHHVFQHVRQGERCISWLKLSDGRWHPHSKNVRLCEERSKAWS